MKKIFYTGAICLALFEVLNVYFIMPMPGSQRMNSLDLAYFLFSYRWMFRVAFGLFIAIGALGTFKATKYKWIPAIVLILPIVTIYFFNFEMSADAMFKQPDNLSLKLKAENPAETTKGQLVVNQVDASIKREIKEIGRAHV